MGTSIPLAVALVAAALALGSGFHGQIPTPWGCLDVDLTTCVSMIIVFGLVFGGWCSVEGASPPTDQFNGTGAEPSPGGSRFGSIRGKICLFFWTNRGNGDEGGGVASRGTSAGLISPRGKVPCGVGTGSAGDEAEWEEVEPEDIAQVLPPPEPPPHPDRPRVGR